MGQRRHTLRSISDPVYPLTDNREQTDRQTDNLKTLCLPPIIVDRSILIKTIYLQQSVVVQRGK